MPNADMLLGEVGPVFYTLQEVELKPMSRVVWTGQP